MSATNAIARDENVRNPLVPEIPDIFIPPTPIGNAGVTGGRNENSGMTTGGRWGRGLFHKHPCGGGSFRSGIQSPTGARPGALDVGEGLQIFGVVLVDPFVGFA